MAKPRLQFKRWEIVVLALASSVFLTALVMYVTDFPLRRYLFSGQAESAGERVGQVGDKQGSLRRQQASRSGFEGINKSAELYNNDTVVTGSASSATLRLDDGSTLSLEPNTMVKLSYETKLSLSGITRTASVNIVSGKITSEAKSRPLRVLERGKEVATVTQGAKQTLQASPVRPVIPPKAATPPDAIAPQPAAAVIPAAKPSPIPSPVPAASPSPSPLPSPSPSVSPEPSPAPSPSLAPSPTPEPLHIDRIEMTAPRPGQHLRVADGSTQAEVPVMFKFSVRPRGRRITVAVYHTKNESGDVTREEVAKESIASQGKSSFSHTFDRAGTYEWEIQGPAGEPLTDAAGRTKSTFVIDPDFTSITVNEPLVGGTRASSSRLENRVLHDFSITLSWKPFPEATDYKIWFANSPNAGNALLEKKLDNATSYVVNKDKVFTGRIYYRISAKLPKGFVVHSKTEPFIFDFLPPIAVLPANGEKLSAKAVIADGGNILFTWQKTNFTDSYDLEISKDPSFSSIYFKANQPDNFFSLKLPPQGTYYWRTRSRSKGLASASSAASTFTVGP